MDKEDLIRLPIGTKVFIEKVNGRIVGKCFGETITAMDIALEGSVLNKLTVHLNDNTSLIDRIWVKR